MNGPTMDMIEKIVRGLSDRIHALEVQDPGSGAGVWQSFTPVVNQGVTLTLSAVVGRWRLAGHSVDIELTVTVSSAGTPSALIFVSLPATLPAIRDFPLHTIRGAGLIVDSNMFAFYGVLAHPRAPRDIYFFRTDAPASNLFGLDPPITLADGDQISFFLRYET